MDSSFHQANEARIDLRERGDMHVYISLVSNTIIYSLIPK